MKRYFYLSDSGHEFNYILSVESPLPTAEILSKINTAIEEYWDGDDGIYANTADYVQCADDTTKIELVLINYWNDKPTGRTVFDSDGEIWEILTLIPNSEARKILKSDLIYCD